MINFYSFPCLEFMWISWVGILLRRFSKAQAMGFKMKDIHVGDIIHAELKKQGRTVNWLAAQIYCEKSNIYKLFRRKSVDLEQLMKISEVLQHNFLRDCFEEIP